MEKRSLSDLSENAKKETGTYILIFYKNLPSLEFLSQCYSKR